MKGNKRILIVAILLLLIAVSYGTYAIYKSSATSGNSIKAAAWVVNVDSTDIVANNAFTLDNLDCGNAQIGQNGTIAPGDTCQATIVIDADGSEVGVHYDVSIDALGNNVTNSQLSVAVDNSSSLTGDIAYSATEGEMEAEVVLNVTWNAVDSAEQNTTDINTQGLSVPVTVTVTQNPNPAPTPTP